MTTFRVPAEPPPAPDADWEHRAPLEVLGDWVSEPEPPDRLLLYARRGYDEAAIYLASYGRPLVATLRQAGGVVREVAWNPNLDRSPSWRQVVRDKAAALISAWHAGAES